ncbi:MAG: hypothetical protein ACM31O_21530 [Bacteroidota bacterium]
MPRLFLEPRVDLIAFAIEKVEIVPCFDGGGLADATAPGSWWSRALIEKRIRVADAPIPLHEIRVELAAWSDPTEQGSTTGLAGPMPRGLQMKEWSRAFVTRLA